MRAECAWCGDIIIDPEYAKLVPPLKTEKYRALKTSIERDGLWEPIIINTENVVLDGHHRFKICQELGVLPRFTVKRFDSKNQERKYVIETNLHRRQLNKIQLAELALKLEPIYSEEAKERQKATQLKGRDEEGNPVFGGVHLNTTEEERGKARDQAAKAVGLTSITYHRAKTILEKGTEELKKKVKNGSVSITYAYKKIKRKEKHENPPELPQGTFDVVYADPPWSYYLGLRGDPELHYNTMPVDEICELEVPTADDAVLFLWATNPKLPQALEVMERWGFTYKTNLVWIKDKIGTGYYFRAKHELLLLGTKGKIPAPMENCRPHSVLSSPRREHSQKPNEIYDFIEVMYPGRNYLELFARNKREGWTVWGDEI